MNSIIIKNHKCYNSNKIPLIAVVIRLPYVHTLPLLLFKLIFVKKTLLCTVPESRICDNLNQCKILYINLTAYVLRIFNFEINQF